MKLKSTLLVIISLILCVAALFACTPIDTECKHTTVGKDGICADCGETVREPEKEDDGPSAEAGDIPLIKDGNVNFQIVASSQVGGDGIMAIDKIISAFNKRTGKTLTRVADRKDNVMEVEVLVGTVKNRGDEYRVDGHTLGYNGYAVRFVGTKILLIGGSDEALLKAIEHFEEKVLKLPEGTGAIDYLATRAEFGTEQKQDNYAISEGEIAGNDVREYTIAYGTDSTDRLIASDLQELLYISTGIYLETVKLEKLEGKGIIIDTVAGEEDKRTDEGFVAYVDGDKNLRIECEFPNDFSETAYNLFYNFLNDSRGGKFKFGANYRKTVDVRNIYYKDFGAVGDGETDDFFAIQRAHEYANLWGHTVNSDGPDSVYYIGKGNGSSYISIKTDTYWHSCKFIFDDSKILPADAERSTPIFVLSPDKSSYRVPLTSLSVTSLSESDTTIGDWVPGRRVLVKITNSAQRHFIRFGENENNGSSQTEILLVNADGTIDPSTPIQWNYEKITVLDVYSADDKPITVSGGSPWDVDGDVDSLKRATVETIFNNAPSEYTYYQRNIAVRRSNSTLKNIYHYSTGDKTAAHAAPYNGFTSVNNCSDVVLSGFIFYKPEGFRTIGAAGVGVGMGSYELSASCANNVTWQDSYQTNFFNDDGSVSYDGMMGTNYCKNLTFDNMFVCSFDAHCGTYNATIKNSTIEHLNFIGEGTITLENVTMYTDGSSAAMIFRKDYGATWQGNVIVNGLTMKTSKKSPNLTLIKTEWVNHYFGYTTYLPEKIEINDAKIVKYEFGVANGERWERDVATNHVGLHIYSHLEKYTGYDISDPNATTLGFPNDWKKCNCAEVYKNAGIKAEDGTPVGFNDTDGDGRCNNKRNPLDTKYDVWCWGFENEPDNTVNANPFVPTEEIYVTNCGTLNIIVPNTDQFKDTKLYIDGKLKEE